MTKDQTPAPAAPVTAQPRRWPSILLALSLTLNLLVLGVVAGAHVRDTSDARRFPPPERTAARDMGFGPFIDALPRDLRGQMGQVLRSRGGMMRPDRTALAQETREMLAALRADPYDSAALEDLLVAQHARVSERVELGRAALLDQISAMSPDERAVFADRLEQQMGRALDRAPR